MDCCIFKDLIEPFIDKIMNYWPPDLKEERGYNGEGDEMFKETIADLGGDKNRIKNKNKLTIRSK